MNAGRELDALVAEKVMGWTDISKEHHWNYVRGCPAGWPDRDSGLMPGMHTTDVFKADYRWIPDYSTDIAAAWQVVEKLGNWKGYMFALSYPPAWHGNQQQWEAGWYLETHDAPTPIEAAKADTAPLAICLAALKAVDGK